MAKGINRANPRFLYEFSSASRSQICVFISHKSEDVAAAKEVADRVMAAGLDVYLDIFDGELQKATREDNARGIVSGIERALARSTNILVLVTDKTRQSWWVPYEIGFSKRGDKGIASLLLKSTDDFPDYLKIERTLRNGTELNTYLSELTRKAGNPLSESAINALPSHGLFEYIRR